MIEMYLTIAIKLIVACVLGGIVGYEREYTNRPAGFRTHILVCVGSALVMITSGFIFDMYVSQVNIDPTRIGAQVISGIGFLGAGTIIRQGFNVRGLTTAASLWAVSAVGIAVGVGFYGGAVIATFLIFVTLILLKKLEECLAKKHRYRTYFIQAEGKNGQISAVSAFMEKHNVNIKNIEFISSEEEKQTLLKLLVKLPGRMDPNTILKGLRDLEGVQRVFEE